MTDISFTLDELDFLNELLKSPMDIPDLVFYGNVYDSVQFKIEKALDG